MISANTYLTIDLAMIGLAVSTIGIRKSIWTEIIKELKIEKNRDEKIESLARDLGIVRIAPFVFAVIIVSQSALWLSAAFLESLREVDSLSGIFIFGIFVYIAAIFVSIVLWLLCHRASNL